MKLSRRNPSIRRTLHLLTFPMCSLLIISVFAHAQTPKVVPAKPGSLSGEVVTAKGAPVPGAQILWQAADGGTPHVLHSDAHGHFQIDPLRPGLYELRASAGGAWSDWEHNVMVRPGTAVNLRLRLAYKAPPGSAAVNLKGTMRTWNVPAPGAGPYDSAVDPKGNIWFTLQQSNQIARFNPDTHEWKLFDVPAPDSGPEGIVADANGNLWFTENSAGKIGRWDLRSGTIMEYTPPSAKDPHSLVFGPDGGLWFTSQNSNLIGRVDIETGKITELSVPTQDAHPDGILSAADGAIWFCELTGQKLGRVDPETSAMTEFTPPGTNVHPQRLAVVGDSIYFTDSTGGRLGRFTLTDKQFKLWASPSGDKSAPYGIAADSTGQIWYEESASGASKLIRFNPGLEIFTVYPMPVADSTVRNIVRDSRGHLWLPVAEANKIVVVE